jgi:putative membrane protein
MAMFHGDGLGFDGVFMWLFWILLIVVIVLAVKALWSGNRDSPGSDRSPLEVLQERFARGEIDEAEYERKRKVLER